MRQNLNSRNFRKFWYFGQNVGMWHINVLDSKWSIAIRGYKWLFPWYLITHPCSRHRIGYAVGGRVKLSWVVFMFHLFFHHLHKFFKGVRLLISHHLWERYVLQAGEYFKHHIWIRCCVFHNFWWVNKKFFANQGLCKMECMEWLFFFFKSVF